MIGSGRLWGDEEYALGDHDGRRHRNKAPPPSTHMYSVNPSAAVQTSLHNCRPPEELSGGRL